MHCAGNFACNAQITTSSDLPYTSNVMLRRDTQRGALRGADSNKTCALFHFGEWLCLFIVDAIQRPLAGCPDE